VAYTGEWLERIWESGILKMREKRGKSRFLNRLMLFWVFLKQNSALNRRKLIKNWQTGMRNFLLGRVAA